MVVSSFPIIGCGPAHVDRAEVKRGVRDRAKLAHEDLGRATEGRVSTREEPAEADVPAPTESRVVAEPETDEAPAPKSPRKPPCWLDGPCGEYGDEDYLVGVAVGSTRESADDAARGEIAKCFSVRIHQARHSEEQVYHHEGSRSSVFWMAGTSDTSTVTETDVQLEGVAKAIGLPQDKVTLVNDGIVALWGACAAESAAIVQHGSGFTAAWRRAYGEETLFDHLNAGGVFDMRHELACAVARMIDGRLDVTPLKEVALAHYGIEDEASFAERLFRGSIPADRRRSTPPLIYRAWLHDDPVAARIVERAADDYAAAASAMVAKVGAPDTHVALGGGVIQQGPDRFRQMIASRIHARYPDATVAAPALLPEYGAALMAAHHVGLDVKELFGKLVRLAPAHGNQGNAHA